MKTTTLRAVRSTGLVRREDWPPTAPGWWGRRDTTPVYVFTNFEVIRGDEYLCYMSGFLFPIPCHAAGLRGRWVGPYETSYEAKEAANGKLCNSPEAARPPGEEGGESR